MPKTKKRPLNMEKGGFLMKSKHLIPSVARCHEIEPQAIHNGTFYSDKTLRKVHREMVTAYNSSTPLSSFRNYMNVVATNKASRGRWNAYIKDGQIKLIRDFFNLVH